VTQEHAEAFDEVTRLRERPGLDKEILPGHPYSVNDDPKYDAADALTAIHTPNCPSPIISHRRMIGQDRAVAASLRYRSTQVVA